MTLILAILSVMLCAGVALVLYLGFVAARGLYRYYRDNQPRRMATPRRDSRDWSRQYMDSIK